MRNRLLLLAVGCGLMVLAIYCLRLPNRSDGGPEAPPPPPGPGPPGPAPGEPARDPPKAPRRTASGWYTGEPGPEEPVPDVPEAVALERLHDPGVSKKEVPGLLRSLGRPTAGHDAIHELILWLEFDESRYDPATGELDRRPRYGSSGLQPRPMRDNPAVVALLRVGEAAAPQLVNEYLYFFENTSREAWHNRWNASGRVDKDLNPLPVQYPGWRLGLIWTVLIHRPEVSRRAVEYALARVADSPEDDHLRRASQDLIRGIVDHYEITAGYPPDKLAKLFPPDALRK